MTKFDKLLLFGLFVFTNLIFLSSVILLNVNQNKNNPLVTSLSSNVLSAEASPTVAPTPNPSTYITPVPTPPDLLSASTQTITTRPTLNFQTVTEGRSLNDQANRVFVGISAGQIHDNPQFILSFMADVPASGVYQGISLVGLANDQTYTAYLKGSAQLVSTKTFSMGDGVNDLGVINLPSGDLNEDNIINSADIAIANQALNSTPGSANWNVYADLNGDGVVNQSDIAIITNNVGKVAPGGIWDSSTVQIATSSATLSTLNQDSTPSATKGYWLWVPGF